jgi:hypothetical protein
LKHAAGFHDVLLIEVAARSIDNDASDQIKLQEILNIIFRGDQVAKDGDNTAINPEVEFSDNALDSMCDQNVSHFFTVLVAI